MDLAQPLASQEVRAAVDEVLTSGRLIGGLVVEDLEAAVSAWLGRRHGVAVSSGTAALELALQAMSIGPGDEVIVPAVSFVATLGAVCRVGATPVVVDTLDEGPWIDPAATRAAVTEATALIVPVHLFGRQAQLDSEGVPVLDDACQATFPGGPSVGRCTAVSFYPTKILGGAGDGGMILTDDEDLDARLRRLRQHGCDARGLVVEPGGTNARMGALAAAVLLARMPTIPHRLNRNRSIAAAYDDVLGDLALPRADEPTVYVLRHPDRDRLAADLKTAGIPTAVYYPRCVHEHPAFADHVRVPRPLARAPQYCEDSLALPLYAELGDDQIDHIVETLRRVL